MNDKNILCENINFSFQIVKNDTGSREFIKDSVYHLKDCVPAGHCFMMLHTLYPYVLTFKKYGWFSWERDKNRVVVCCPGTQNRCCAEFRRKPESGGKIALEYRILNIEGSCPCYSKDQVINIEDSFNEIFWIIFNTLYLYSSRNAELNNVVVHCDTKEDLAVKIIG